MGRSKKVSSNSLILRLSNAGKTPPPNNAEARLDWIESFEGEITDAVIDCPACGAERVSVPSTQVPPQARVIIERSAKIKEFVYCPACKTYSGFSSL